MKRFICFLGFVAFVLALVLPGCGGGGGAGKGPIVVGSKIDTEGSLLSQIIIRNIPETAPSFLMRLTRMYGRMLRKVTKE